MDFPTLVGSSNQQLAAFIKICIFAMLRDKQQTIPRDVANAPIGFQFLGRRVDPRTVRAVLQQVHFDVWPTNPRVVATFNALERCPALAWQIVFLSSYFASLVFMETLVENIQTVAALGSHSLAEVFKAAVGRDSRHVAGWFGSGHQYVRLQANHLRQFGRTQARQKPVCSVNFLVFPKSWTRAFFFCAQVYFFYLISSPKVKTTRQATFPPFSESGRQKVRGRTLETSEQAVAPKAGSLGSITKDSGGWFVPELPAVASLGGSSASKLRSRKR